MRLFFSSKSKKKSGDADEEEKPPRESVTEIEESEDIEGTDTDQAEDQEKDEEENGKTTLEADSASADVLQETASAGGQSAGEDTQKKRARDRSLYKQLLNCLYDAVLVVDAKGNIVESNDRAGKFFGYGKGELWNKKCEELINAMNMPNLAKIQTHTQDGKFTVVKATCSRQDGSAFPGEIAITNINLLHEDDLILTVRNLERREGDQKNNEGMDTLENVAVGIAICTQEGDFAYVNPAFVSLLQYKDQADLLESNIRKLCVQEEAASPLLQVKPTARPWTGRLKLVNAKGWTHEFIVTSAASNSGDTEKNRLILTLTQIPKSIPRPASEK